MSRPLAPQYLIVGDSLCLKSICHGVAGHWSKDFCKAIDPFSLGEAHLVVGPLSGDNATQMWRVASGSIRYQHAECETSRAGGPAVFLEPETRRAGRRGLIGPQRSTLRGNEPRDQLDAGAVGPKRVYLAPLEPAVTGIVYRGLTVLVIPSDRARSERDHHHAGMRVPAILSGIAKGCDLR